MVKEAGKGASKALYGVSAGAGYSWSPCPSRAPRGPKTAAPGLRVSDIWRTREAEPSWERKRGWEQFQTSPVVSLSLVASPHFLAIKEYALMEIVTYKKVGS